jgi:hypothetical protein
MHDEFQIGEILLPHYVFTDIQFCVRIAPSHVLACVRFISSRCTAYSRPTSFYPVPLRATAATTTSSSATVGTQSVVVTIDIVIQPYALL